MVLAVTSENGEIFQHFGKCPGFDIYHIEGNKIISKDYVSTNGSGHSLLFEFLKELSSYFCLGTCDIINIFFFFGGRRIIRTRFRSHIYHR